MTDSANKQHITQTFGNLLQVSETVAQEKSIDQEDVLNAMEQAIQKAAKAKYGHENDIRIQIDRSTGEVTIFNCRTVVEEAEDPVVQLTLEEAKKEKPDAQIGDVLEELLPPIEFGRVAAQSARQVIIQRVREAERARQYEEFKGRVNEVISGIVRRNEFGNIIIDLGRAEAILRRDETIPRETFQTGDRVRGYMYDIRPEVRGAMIFVSRIRPEFMAELFKQEVPEVYDGIIEIKSVARDPGSRAKIAVYSSEPNVDPVGACVGMRGSRVQAVVSELQGEKVDIVPWSSDTATFIVNALSPAEITKVVIDEDEHRVDVVVDEDQLSLAIGRRGQNVRLASHLTGWRIDVMTEGEESERRTQEYATRTQTFMEALDVDEMIAQLLAAEGFTSVEELSEVDSSEISNVEGFEEELAQEIQTRAQTYLNQKKKTIVSDCKKKGAKADLLALEGLPLDVLKKIVDQGIRTLNDFADLASDELIEITGTEILSTDQANALIMKAREPWFDKDEPS